MLKRFKLAVPAVVTAAGLVFLVAAIAADQQTGTQTMDQVARGRYLVTVAGCNDCHTPKNWTDMGPVLDSTRLLSGHPASEVITQIPDHIGKDGWVASGNGSFTAWAGPWGISFAANLTSDKKTGLGNWTDEQFIKAMRTGKHRGFGRAILPPMPWPNLAQATDQDLAAMLAYLKSTRPVTNEVPAPVEPPKK